MQLICVYLHGQCIEFNHEIHCVLLPLLEGLYFPFSICCLRLVTECGLDFLDKIFPILGSSFFIQLIKLSSLNFVWLPSNHPGSGIIFFGIPACPFLLTVTAGVGTVDISSVVVCLYLLEASSVICKDPSCSNNVSILFVLLKLVLGSFCSLYYMCFVPDR